MGIREKIQELYNEEHIINSLSYKEIQTKYNIHRGIWNYHAQKLGLQYDGRKHRPNDDYFDSLDTYNKNYILGFLYADGCITKDNRISILLHHQDIEVLELIQKELCPNVVIEHRNDQNIKRSPQVKLRFKSHKLVSRLKELGFCLQKTSTDSEIFKYVPEEWKHAFILGYTDGDGSIRFQKYPSHKGYKIEISWTNGSKQLLEDMEMYFFQKLGFNGNVKSFKNVSVYYVLGYYKQLNVYKICKLLYKDANTFTLSRKFNKAKGIVEYLNDTEVK
jgi:hypothetical protein